MITTNGFEVGATVEYSCDEGHLLVGPAQRTCLETGFYNEFPPVCKYIECGLPASIPHGNYNLVNGSVGYLSQVVYRCNDGFEMLGRAMLTCDIDERWNGPPPRCEVIECDALPDTYKNTKILTQNGTYFGSKAEFQCPKGYSLNGPKSITCTANGQWNGPVTECLQDEIPTVIPISSTTTTLPPSPPISITKFTRTKPSVTSGRPVTTAKPVSRFSAPTSQIITTKTSRPPPTILTTTRPASTASHPKVISVKIENKNEDEDDDDFEIPGTVREDLATKHTIRPIVLIPKTSSTTTKETTKTPKFRPSTIEPTTDHANIHPQDNEILHNDDNRR